MNQHSNLWLSIGSAIGSALSYFIAFVTDYHIMALLGFICVVVSIASGVLTIVEKRMSIRQMREGVMADAVRTDNLIKRLLRRKSGGRL